MIRDLSHLQEILSRVSYPDRFFVLGKMGDGFYLQIEYTEPDVETGEPAIQRGRKWYVSSHAIEAEVVQTAFLAALTSAEHQTREHFRYRGKAIFGPHMNLDALVELCGAGALVHREPRAPAQRRSSTMALSDEARNPFRCPGCSEPFHYLRLDRFDRCLTCGHCSACCCCPPAPEDAAMRERVVRRVMARLGSKEDAS